MAHEIEIVRLHRDNCIRGRKECLKDIRENGIKYATKKYGDMLSFDNFNEGLDERFFRSGYRMTLIGVRNGSIIYTGQQGRS